MEIGVRALGMFLRILDFLTWPLIYLLNKSKHTQLPAIKNPLLLESGVSLAEKIRQGKTSSEEIVKMYIERIREVNPLLNAVVDERFSAALEEAKLADALVAERRKHGNLERLKKEQPLCGVPFTVKESCSLTGMSNAVGCLEWQGRRACGDGAAVAAVRASGAVPLLVSNTPELCLGWESANLLNGTTNNPYCLASTPGGSSGGEAALIASAASPFGVASDIAGSIRIPAAFTGVFGHKPTPGVISIEGHIPMLNDENYSKFLAVGPIARCADDLRLLMQIMVGHNNELRLDDDVDLTGAKVLYMEDAGPSLAMQPVDKCIKETIRAAATYLSKECHMVLDEQKFPEMNDSVELSVSVFFGMKDIPNLLQDPANPKKDKNLFLEIIKSLFGFSTRSLQGLGFMLIKQTNLFIPRQKYGYYCEKRDQLRSKIIEVLGERGVLLYPVFTQPAYRHGQVFTKPSGVMFTMLFNVLGLPATAVPTGLDSHNMPVAIQVIAAPYQDRLCLAVAKKLEEAFGGWKPPPAQ